MTLFLQAAAAVLLAVILALCLEKQGKDMALLLTAAVSVMVLAAGISYLQPVIRFIEQLQKMGNLNSNMVAVLLKIVGIGLLSEIASLVCADAGHAAVGKSLQILASCVILWLSLPVFEVLLDLIQGILGEV